MATASATMTLRLQNSEKKLLQSYALLQGLSLSEFVKKAALEKIEDEIDLKVALDAKAKFEANPVTISADEIEGKYL